MSLNAGYNGGGGGGGGSLLDGALNPLAALIAPLAALALLGAAAAVSANPSLIQLAVINNNGRRKKRTTANNDEEFELLNFVGNHADLTMAEFLSCSSLLRDECLQLLACKAEEGSLPQEFGRIVPILLRKVSKNSRVSDDIKRLIEDSRSVSPLPCDERYQCPLSP